MGALLDHQRPYRLLASGNQAPLILLASGVQLRVKFSEVPRFRHRHPVVTPEVARLAFDAAFFVWFGRRAKLALEVPVRAESDEPCGFLASVAAQDLLYRALQVVVAQQPKNALKVLERVLVGIQKRLLGGAMKCSMERRAA